MKKEVIANKVTIDGLAHYVDPYIDDGDRTWCGEPIGPWTTRDWQKRAQMCHICLKKLEDANGV